MDKCSGGLEVSEMALLSMLGGGRFSRVSVVSDSDAARDRLAASVKESGLAAVSAAEGVTKSSLKRRLVAPEAYPAAYDETGPAGLARRYLERSAGSWRVAGFDARTGEACVEMKTGVRLSVAVPRQFTSRI